MYMHMCVYNMFNDCSTHVRIELFFVNGNGEMDITVINSQVEDNQFPHGHSHQDTDHFNKQDTFELC